MQFNPAAGKAHTAVPPGHSCSTMPRGCLRSQEGPCVLALLSAVAVLDVHDSPQHSSATTPGASVACQLTAASMKLNWQLKGYTTGFSADVQTLSIILPVPCRKNAHELSIPIQRGNVCASRIWLAVHVGVRTLAAQCRVCYFNIMHLMPCFAHFPAEKVHGNPQADAQIPLQDKTNN